MNIHDIQKVLPHRYPMLLVDRIEELELGRRVKGFKNVTANECFFQGHYPDMPIMPGALVVESMAQVSATIMLADPKFSGYRPLLAGLDEVKFKKPVYPGDRLTTEAEVLWFRNGLGCVQARASVDGEMVAEGKIFFKIIKDGEKA
jgi:3-hydroxyacyl-[acyl-carrier-protein] dehydratase